VYAWGYDGAGQLGDGTTVDKASPVAVVGLSNVVYIAAGDSRDDLIWKEAGGTVVQWLMNGYLSVPTVTVLGGVGAGWAVVGQN
jgi:hypothetical protein